MSTTRRALQGSDVVGVGRLAIDAVAGLTDVVEAMHGTIAQRPLPIGTVEDTRTRGLTRLVYQSIRGVTRLVGNGLDLALPLLASAVGEGASSPRREVALAVLNGVIGDHLAATHNPLAIPMRFRAGGIPVEISPAGVAALAPSNRLLVLVHGLCMCDLQWRRRGHDHGEALAAALGYTSLYLHYDSGRHVSENGRDFAERLDALVAAWPVPLDELVILGHSMGGLVARSACHYARLDGRGWLPRLSALVFLGTPHHGAVLERAGNLFELLLAVSPYAAPIAQIGGNRSAGINDLRFGNVVDEDWNGCHRRYRSDPRTPVPLPEGVDCYTVAATRGRKKGDAPSTLIGDGLVHVGSALGRHDDPRFRLAFPPDHEHVAYGADHFDLLNAPEIYDRLVGWLGERRRAQS